MPLVGSSAYNSVAQITSLTRSLLNDAAGNWATDSVLLPYLNSAYRTLQRKLGNTGGDGEITDNALLVVAAIPANQQDPSTETVLNDATAPPNQLPTNLKVPLKIWERENGTSNDFVEMQDWTNKGGLPSRPQGFTLNSWEWRTDGIYFIGATVDVQIRLRYESYFYDLVGPADIVLIRGAQEALAYMTAGLAGMARGSPLAPQMEQLAVDAQEDVILENVRANARQGARRRPYNYRNCGRGWRGRF